MRPLPEYELVRIRQLLRPAEAYDGWNLNQRPPRVGDVGYIVDVLTAPGHEESYVVECSGPDGVDVWLGDFSFEELELVEDSPRPPVRLVDRIADRLTTTTWTGNRVPRDGVIRVVVWLVLPAVSGLVAWLWHVMRR